MRYRALGDVRVGAIGLGAMPLSIEGHPDEARALATVHAALDAGVTLLDTADSYHPPGGGPGAGERLVARALAAYGGPCRTDDVLVATKGGRGRTADGGWTVDGRPEHLRRAAGDSARRLGVEAIGLYQLHKPDPAVPYAESLGAIRELLDAGTIRLAGISNVDTERILLAREILGERLVSVQNRYSPADRGSEAELRLCADLGLAFMPWSPLGGIARSSLDGTSALEADPRFGAFHRVARAHGVTPQRVTLAWLLTRSETVLPIPGASRPESIRDSAGATGLELTEGEVEELNGCPGGRFSPSGV
ncbi:MULTISPECIES: aldo/keto reductase [unclassified Streptomyces]|uniref:aldo/keto reductase n=1 Tax=unclassified Streptomyces TaxID=2593676 RepID=UPI00070198E4|nr:MULTISPECIES: aldo/keto reductase [unclassified Streptomyces]KQX47396.1 aldo/keto reductase [Streptomyces sp. Root1304]KRA94703.1 aldo/keto reductase [Streptomyces sp. Root66D1]